MHMVDTGVRVFMEYLWNIIIQCLPAQMFYCILKQPSETTASYTCNRRNNTSYDVFVNGKTYYPI